MVPIWWPQNLKNEVKHFFDQQIIDFRVMDFLTGFFRRHPGGTQEAPGRHPPEVFPPSPSDVWDLILCKPLHKFTFGYNVLYIFYSKLEPDPSKRGPWDDPGAPLTSSTKKAQTNILCNTQKWCPKSSKSHEKHTLKIKGVFWESRKTFFFNFLWFSIRSGASFS